MKVPGSAYVKCYVFKESESGYSVRVGDDEVTRDVRVDAVDVIDIKKVEKWKKFYRAVKEMLR